MLLISLGQPNATKSRPAKHDDDHDYDDYYDCDDYYDYDDVNHNPTWSAQCHRE